MPPTVLHSVNFSHLSKKHISLIVGPRQVGKTFVCSSAQTLTKNFNCLNWDNKDHRNIILSGPTKLADYLGLQKSFDIYSKITDILIKQKRMRLNLY